MVAGGQRGTGECRGKQFSLELELRLERVESSARGGPRSAEREPWRAPGASGRLDERGTKSRLC